MHTLIQHMTPVQRAVFLLKDVYDFSLADIAEKLQMTPGAVKAALHRARRSLVDVRRDLEKDAISLPMDSEYRNHIEELTSACMRDDIEKLIQLTMFGGGAGKTSDKLFCMAT